MKLFSGRLLAAAAALLAVPAFASAAITLNIGSTTLSESAGVQNFTLDVRFTNDGASSPMVGYDVALQITGGSGLTITGMGTSGNGNLITNPVIASFPTFGTSGSLYLFSDASGSPGSIDNNDGLFRILLQAAGGTTGAFQISFFQSVSDPLDTKIYTDFSANEVPITSFNAGTVTINAIPEPAAMSLALFALPLLARRRVR